MNNIHKIYVHINKTNNKLYIGQTKEHDVNKRWKNGYGYKNNKYFWNAIKKYGWENFDHIVLIENLSLEEANIIEEELINKYNTTNKNFGYNLKSGGRHSKMSEETRMKISKSKMGHKVTMQTRIKISKNHADFSGDKNPRYGKHCSEETKKKIRENNKSEGRIGVKKPPETIKKMIDNHADFSGDKNPKAKKVVQLSLDNHYINTFSTLVEAGKSIGQKSSNITVCCQNINRTAGGYKWRYYDDYTKELCNIPSA